METIFLHSDITSAVIKAYYTVYNKLGYGFLEKVYENALIIELVKMGLECATQKQISVFYDKIKVGVYYSDIIINNSVIVDIKAAEILCEAHEAQLINYLKATDIEVGLLLNFGKKAAFVRKIFSNNNK